VARQQGAEAADGTMKPDRTATQRQSRARQALAESGGRTVTVKLDKPAVAALASICASCGIDQQTAIRMALLLLAQN